MQIPFQLCDLINNLQETKTHEFKIFINKEQFTQKINYKNINFSSFVNERLTEKYTDLKNNNNYNIAIV